MDHFVRRVKNWNGLTIWGSIRETRLDNGSTMELLSDKPILFFFQIKLSTRINGQNLSSFYQNSNPRCRRNLFYTCLEFQNHTTYGHPSKWATFFYRLRYFPFVHIIYFVCDENIKIVQVLCIYGDNRTWTIHQTVRIWFSPSSRILPIISFRFH